MILRKIDILPYYLLLLNAAALVKNKCIFDLYTIGIKDVRWLERKWVLVVVMDCG